MAPPTVCVLDGELPLARAVLSLLSTRDVQVILAHSDHADAEAIRRAGPCSATFAYPDPRDLTGDFETDLIDLLRRARPKVVLPLGIETTLLLARHREQLAERRVAAPVPSEDHIALALDRGSLWSRAQSLGIACPTWARPSLGARMEDLLDLFGDTPALVPRLASRPEAALTPQSIELLLHEREAFERRTGDSPLLMERLTAAQGWLAVTALCDAPGGVMARVCELWSGWDRAARRPRWRSITDHAEAASFTRALLEALEWTGPATLQFSVAEGREPVLLQCWPGLSGGIGLAAEAGLDLIWPLVEWALGHPPTDLAPYRTDIYQPWIADNAPWIFAPSAAPIPNLTPQGERAEGVNPV